VNWLRLTETRIPFEHAPFRFGSIIQLPSSGKRPSFHINDNGGLQMKKLLFAAALTVLSAGIANAQWRGSCIGNNSKACTDARNAFAEHHGGVFPEQYYNSWYGGHQGRWYQHGAEWRWEGTDGRDWWGGHWRHHH
jgi:hypothetical protein